MKKILSLFAFVAIVFRIIPPIADKLLGLSSDAWSFFLK
jgi:hypothetical protein